MVKSIQKKYHLIAILTVFAVLFSSACPYICELAQASTKSHSCCPEDKSHHNQNKKEQNSEECCDQHDAATLVNKSTDSSFESIHYQLVAFIIELMEPLAFHDTVAYQMNESPPGSTSAPLYIIKSSFLI